MIPITTIKNYLWSLQQTICQALLTFETKKTFLSDLWQNELGNGISCILERGQVFEKAGINVSHIQHYALPEAARKKRPDLTGYPYQAIGISVVIHPRNPYVPTTHANLRYLQVSKHHHKIWWFGGGFDLTPYYGFVEDCRHWHHMAKSTCDPFGKTLYPTFKAACDAYFYLPHRQEARGIGGIFFDDIQLKNFDTTFQFIQQVGAHFLKAYLPIVQKRYKTPYGRKEKMFQYMRRGRYVEFNLLHDRGTLFGLQSQGRIASILMSMPPHVSWHYNWHPQVGSLEASLYTDFLPAKDWLSETYG